MCSNSSQAECGALSGLAPYSFGGKSLSAESTSACAWEPWSNWKSCSRRIASLSDILLLGCGTSRLSDLGFDCNVALATWRGEEVPNTPNLRANAAQLFFDALITAVNVVNPVQNRLAIRNQCRQYQRCGCTQVRAHHHSGR